MHFGWVNVDDAAITSDSSNLHQYHRDKFSIECKRKIQDVKHILQSKAETDPTESLAIIDDIQRLGVNCYFQEEIDTNLQQLHRTTTRDVVHGFDTLHDVSLLFSLFRQHGYYVSPEVFKKFTGKDGKFRSELSQDIGGLMQLYEAAQLSFEGEDILDEAAIFSCRLLHERLADVGESWPIMIHSHRSIKILTEKDFVQDFGGKNEYEKALRELAVMDLHGRRVVYQEEMLQISKWWNKLGIAKNLKLARIQPQKWYTWSMTSLIDDITMSVQRVELTKCIAFGYLIDDLYDLYGTLDELTVFTEAVNKWDYAAIDSLPEYMKTCYRALLDTTNETGRKIHNMHGHDPIDSLKTTWASLCNAFLMEAKWFASGNLPIAQVYLENGKVSSGAHVVLVHLFFLLGLGGSAAHLKDISQLISCIASIIRLWDDLGSAEDENQDGEDGSYIECYMKEHPGVTVDQARENATSMIASEWKRLNKECFSRDHLQTSTLKRASLNFARMVDLVYGYDENQQLPVLEEYANFMLPDKTIQGTNFIM